ncbi:hypothetical protein BO71DRAFT_393734, partial [Aspergillus ellipticus CBS 707.79]
MAFGLVELVVHGLLFSFLAGSPYNPGLATSVFGFTPIGIIYLRHAYANNLISPTDWVLAVLFAAGNYWLSFFYIGIDMMSSKNSKYPFTKEEMDRFNSTAWWPGVWMDYYRDNWYYFTAVFFVAGSFFMGFFGDFFSRIQVILIYNTLALCAHQIEEYILPSGAPLIINVALHGEKKDYDRFPGNKRSMVWVNTLAYPFYLSAVSFPHHIWLGLAQSYFGLMQVIGHGPTMNIKANTAYNPGLATALLLHMPIGIYYIVYVQQNGLVSLSDWIYSVPALIASMVGIIILPVAAFRDRQSPFPATMAEMSGFDMLNKFKAKGMIKS